MSDKLSRSLSIRTTHETGACFDLLCGMWYDKPIPSIKRRVWETGLLHVVDPFRGMLYVGMKQRGIPVEADSICEQFLDNMRESDGVSNHLYYNRIWCSRYSNRQLSRDYHRLTGMIRTLEAR